MMNTGKEKIPQYPQENVDWGLNPTELSVRKLIQKELNNGRKTIPFERKILLEAGF